MFLVILHVKVITPSKSLGKINRDSFARFLISNGTGIIISIKRKKKSDDFSGGKRGG